MTAMIDTPTITSGSVYADWQDAPFRFARLIDAIVVLASDQ